MGISGCLPFYNNIRRKANANIFANGAPILTPISVPIGAMPCSFFTFAAALFPTACILLAISDFTVHESNRCIRSIREPVGADLSALLLIHELPECTTNWTDYWLHCALKILQKTRVL